MSAPGGALLIAGTTSDAGKSVLVAGICRLLRRRGVRVAPFKAQNMSNNSVVTLDGGEIGRAQALQAQACGLEPSVRFNPILLKPGSDRRSQLVVRGRVTDTVSAADYITHRTRLRAVVAAELAALRAEFDVVICEGAGSPAEINLRATDLANMGLARAAELPVLVIGDIDRGGVLAHLFGTLAVLEPEDQRLIAGFVINKFRGDVDLLRPGLDQLAVLTGRPTLGVLPYRDDLWLDAEDSLGTVSGDRIGRPGPAVGSEWLSVAAIRLPRISNSTDVEALACEPGVAVRWVTEVSQLVAADLVVVPGSKATVEDLDWLRRTGIGDELRRRAAAGRPVLGICGGYQMLGHRIVDPVESGAGAVAGLGLLDMEVEFAPEKVLCRTAAVGASPLPGTEPADTAGIVATGYEIHHGRVRRTAESPWLRVTRRSAPDDRTGAADGELAGAAAAEPAAEGAVRGAVWGTHLHGLLESDEFRRVWLAQVARAAGRTGFTVAPGTRVAAVRAAQLDLLADLVAENLEVSRLEGLLAEGVPSGLPVVESTVGALSRIG